MFHNFFFDSCMVVTKNNLTRKSAIMRYFPNQTCTVFPHIRPAGIIFFAQPSTVVIIRMQVLFEGWYYFLNM